MKKAFIFDVDGVIINNEPIWDSIKKDIFAELFGQDIASRFGSTIGLHIGAIHQRAIQLGSTKSLKEVFDTFGKYAASVYTNTPIAPGINELGNTLARQHFLLGIVSATPKAWIDLALNRLSFRQHITVIISLYDRPDLKHKPSPDGYKEAMKLLCVSPDETYILEDSNVGIRSAKTAGGYVIGLRQNLVQGYIQEGADTYADKANEVMQIIKNHQMHAPY